MSIHHAHHVPTNAVSNDITLYSQSAHISTNSDAKLYSIYPVTEVFLLAHTGALQVRLLLLLLLTKKTKTH